MPRIITPLALAFALSACDGGTETHASKEMSESIAAERQRFNEIYELSSCINKRALQAHREISARYQRPALDPAVIRRLPDDKKWEIILNELSAIENEGKERENADKQAEDACKAEQNSQRAPSL